MKKSLTALLAAALIMPCAAFSAPGGPQGGPQGGQEMRGHGPSAPQGRPKPGSHINILPDLATAVIIGGLTYWAANGTYYQKQGSGYVVVEQPVSPSSGSMQVLDYGGKRYYVKDGHYYSRDINGNYAEIPRPAGL